MPDPILYLKAFIAVVIASATVLPLFWMVTRKSEWSLAVSCVLAVSVGLVIGYAVLQFSWTWPPANALNRFLLIILPATLFVELLTAAFNVGTFSRSLTVILRIILYACAGRVLLHDSVYLAGVSRDGANAWSLMQNLVTFGGGFAALTAVWSLLCRLSHRSDSCSITLSLAMAIVCTALTTMMAGYIRGGVAAIPLTAALTGSALVGLILAQAVRDHGKPFLYGLNGIGVMGLFCLLSIGHYFGQLSGLSATVIFLAPLLCWTSEFPGLRSKSPWQKSVLQLIAVTIPLAAVLFAARRDFDQNMAPLLAGVLSTKASINGSPALGSSPSFLSQSRKRL
jgi:hypothetical protein